MEEFVFIMV